MPYTHSITISIITCLLLNALGPQEPLGSRLVASDGGVMQRGQFVLVAGVHVGAFGDQEAEDGVCQIRGVQVWKKISRIETEKDL